MATQFKSPYRDNITTDKVLNLSAKNEQGKRANWTIRYAGNKVRLTVWTGIDGDVDNGSINAVIDVNHFMQFLALFEEVIHSQEKGAKVMTIRALGREGWKKPPIDKGDLYCGRNGEGVIFLSYVVPNRPKIMFPLQEDAFFMFKNKDGNPLSKQEASNIVAKGYLQTVRDIIIALTATEYVAKEDRPNPNRRKDNNNQQKSNYQDDDFGSSTTTTSSDDFFSNDIDI